MGARVTSNGCQNLGFCRAVDEEAVMVARVPRRLSKAMNLRRRVGIFQSSFQHVGVRDNSRGDQLFGFGSREAVDHVFVVGFVR